MCGATFVINHVQLGFKTHASNASGREYLVAKVFFRAPCLQLGSAAIELGQIMKQGGALGRPSPQSISGCNFIRQRIYCAFTNPPILPSPFCHYSVLIWA